MVWKGGGGGKEELYMETPDKYCFSQVIKVNISSDNSHDDRWTIDGVGGTRPFTSVVFFPQTHNPTLSMRKTKNHN